MRAGLPAELDIFDAHTHLGHDIDGMVGVYDELIGGMDRYGVSRANMFCLDEPERGPRFSFGNDRTLEFAARSEGRLIPFVRLDLNEGPLEEAHRCLDLGARGIKLHPRAQKFLPNDERLVPVFALAAERRVPILIHAGRGLPPIAAGLEKLVDDHPGSQLILAHAGIADLANLAHRFSGSAASSSTRPSGARSTCSASCVSCRRNRSSTHPTIRTEAARLAPPRAARRADRRPRRAPHPGHVRG